ncbi:MAG: TonB-dependent receptor [Bacteroidetes bacterium]|nr:TonB-dependent receptor [Bacteroidota bacterium]
MKAVTCVMLIVALVSTCAFSYAQSIELNQTIKGIVIDADSKKALSSATVSIAGTSRVTVADSMGNFRFANVPIGRQTILVSLLGYENNTVAEVLVTSGKEIFLTIPLREKVTSLSEVKLVGRKSRLKASNEFASTSSRGFSVEETKRYAATAFDPARMAQNFAGVSNNGDGDNSIVVRGNSPQGVLWRLEGIEIPSPNHFGGLGGSGGSISMLSSSMLGNSDFYTGAFPAEFGNALSGAFDLKFRDGNKDKREHSFMIGGLGLELATEGPFKKGGSASYLVNYRYSTLTLMKSFLDLDGIIPDYQDLSFKFNFPTKKAGTFSVFGIGGLNKATKDPDKDSTKWDDDHPNFVLNNKGKLGVLGITHQVFLSKNSYLKTILSASINQYDERVDTLDPNLSYSKVKTFRSNFEDDAYRLSVLYNNKINSRHTLRTGFIVSRLGFNYDNSILDESDDQWKTLLHNKGNTVFYQAYAQWKFRISNKLTTNAGLHASSLALNNTNSLEPRVSVSFQPDKTQSVVFSAGMHSKPQHLSTYFYEKKVAGQPLTTPNKNLDLSRALHIVLAYDKTVGSGIKFKTEAYYQHLYKIPVEKDVNGFFSSINAADVYSLYEVDSALVSSGKGENYGIDISVEKSFTKNYYFLVAGSVFNSKYTTYAGKEYSTKFNRNYQVNIVGGKEWKTGKNRNRIIGLNGKLLASGALRDSPIDLAASQQQGKAVYVPGKYYSVKSDPYYRLDIGISYKINRKHATHTASFDIQNVTNHQNIYGSWYDNDKGKIKKEYQMGLFPIFNYRIEF